MWCDEQIWKAASVNNQNEQSFHFLNKMIYYSLKKLDLCI